jgi:hypothetical protein
MRQGLITYEVYRVGRRPAEERFRFTDDRPAPGRKRARNATRHRILLPVAASLLLIAPALAEDKEPTAIIELGGAAESGLPGSSSFGPSAAIEFTPIKDWLEIEAGVSPLLQGGRTEWDTDLIFKKPFTLSDKVEFMLGAGPSWSFSREGTKMAAQLAADFMIWPTKDRNYGWFVEPTYNYSLAKGHEQSLGVAMGLLIPIP